MNDSRGYGNRGGWRKVPLPARKGNAAPLNRLTGTQPNDRIGAARSALPALSAHIRAAAGRTPTDHAAGGQRYADLQVSHRRPGSLRTRRRRGHRAGIAGRPLRRPQGNGQQIRPLLRKAAAAGHPPHFLRRRHQLPRTCNLGRPDARRGTQSAPKGRRGLPRCQRPSPDTATPSSSPPTPPRSSSTKARWWSSSARNAAM